jgi:hypothetical protein
MRALVKFAVLLSLAGLLAGFVLFVWPTRYRYDRMQVMGENAPGAVYPVRVDRWSGAAEILLPEMLGDARHDMALAWVGAPGQAVPTALVDEIRKNALIEAEPLPWVQILNPTNWRITKTRWRVTSAAGANTPTPRSVDRAVFIEPGGVASFYLEIGRFGRGASITLEGAWGVPD